MNNYFFAQVAIIILGSILISIMIWGVMDSINFTEYQENFCKDLGYDGLNQAPRGYDGYCYKILNGKIHTKNFYCINLSLGQKHECFLMEN